MTKSKMIKTPLCDLPSGEVARNFRKRLASRSTAMKASSLLTSKFKLDFSKTERIEGVKALLNFENLKKLYDTNEGIEKGSLSYFLFSVILSGFRIFSDEASTKLFLTRRVFDEEAFQKALTEVVGAGLPQFTIASLLKRLQSEVRATKRPDGTLKNNSFTAEVIQTEYRKTLCPKVPKDADETILTRLFEDFARALLNAGFDSWADLKKDLPKACRAFDQAVKNHGTFPSLATMVEMASELTLPAKSTIVFDDTRPFVNIVELPSNLTPHAVVASLLNYPEAHEAENPANFVKDHLTTPNASGLSWLFNKGLALFKEESVEDLCEMFNVPELQANRIKQIKDAAVAIPEQVLLTSSRSLLGYHVFRRSFSGRTDSWVTNYCKRLVELETICSTFVDGLQALQIQPHWKVNISNEEIQLLTDCFNVLKPKAVIALSNLLGNSVVNLSKDIEIVEETYDTLNRLIGIKNTLKIRSNHASQSRAVDGTAIASEIEKELIKWDSIKELPKLNLLSGGVPDVECELKDAKAKLDLANRARREHLNALLSWAESNGVETGIHSYINQALVKNEKLVSKELVIRRLLQRLGRIVRFRHDVCADEVRNFLQPFFMSGKDYRNYFFEGKGTLFASPFNRGRHQAYALKSEILANPELFWDKFCAVIEKLRDQIAVTHPAYRTLSKLENFYASILIDSISQPIPREQATLHLTDDLLDNWLHSGIRIQLNQETVYPVTLVIAFNLYESIINGAFNSLKDRFFISARFLWAENSSLLYVPKDVSWKIPERYLKSKKFEDLPDSIFVRDSSGGLLVLETFQNTVVFLEENPDSIGARELLHQLPHTWNYALNVPGESSRKPSSGALPNALSCQKKGTQGTQLRAVVADLGKTARLVGTNRYKERLNDILLDPANTLSEMTLYARQECEIRGESVKRSDTQFELAIPISTSVGKEEETVAPFKRIIAIDQGEMGIAYAVFDLKSAGDANATPIAQGTVPVPSIRAVIKNVRQYRKKGQPLSNFSKKFDASMFACRESCAGDVCGAIEGLMAKWHAFPVLENQVKNLASGSKQLELVYKMVNARFLYSDVQAHNSEREAWWMGAGSWDVDGYLKGVPSELITDKSRQKKAVKNANGILYFPLKVFPGIGVNAIWTSRICSCCGRNAFELFSRFTNETKGKGKVSTDAEGKFTLYGEMIQLFNRPTNKERQRLIREANRRRKNGEAVGYKPTRYQREPWTKPLANKTFSIPDLKRLTQTNLRRPPIDMRTKDTTQSRYYCVFSDCPMHGREQHADVNAAINIGRRLLGQIVKA